MELDNLRSAVCMGWAKTAGAKSQLDEIDRILKRIPAEHSTSWLNRSDINTALGFVHGERAGSDIGDGDVLLALEAAVKHFNLAVSQERADVPVRALEKRANCAVKLALQRWLRDRGGKQARKSADDNAGMIDHMIANLKTLLDMGETTERHSLLGSAYKRKAWIVLAANKPDEIKAALTGMAEHYRKAFDQSEQRGRIDAYPLTNWLAAVAVAGWLTPRSRKPDLTQAKTWCEQAKQDAAEKDRTAPDFWNGLVQADCDLAMNLANLTDEAGESITASYQAAIERGCSASENGSVLEHLQFLREMALAAHKAPVAKVLEAMLIKLKQ